MKNKINFGLFDCSYIKSTLSCDLDSVFNLILFHLQVYLNIVHLFFNECTDTDTVHLENVTVNYLNLNYLKLLHNHHITWNLNSPLRYENKESEQKILMILFCQCFLFLWRLRSNFRPVWYSHWSQEYFTPSWIDFSCLLRVLCCVNCWSHRLQEYWTPSWTDFLCCLSAIKILNCLSHWSH